VNAAILRGHGLLRPEASAANEAHRDSKCAGDSSFVRVLNTGDRCLAHGPRVARAS